MSEVIYSRGLGASQGEINRQKWEELMESRRQRYERYGFRTRDELVSHVLGGGMIVVERGTENTLRWMQLNKERNVVEHYQPYSYYSPSKTEMSVDDFVKWTEWMDDDKNKVWGYVAYWQRADDALEHCPF